MKKLFKILGIILVSIFLLLLITPYFFKDKIFNLIQEEANKTLKGDLVIQDFGLSFISDFPNLSMNLEGLSYIGSDVFKDEKLFSIGDISLEIDLFSVISGDQYEIKSIVVSESDINIKVLKDGSTNYDIMVESAGEEIIEEEINEEAEPFNLKLNNFQLTDFNLSYTDQVSNMAFSVIHLNHTLNGNFGDDIVNIFTKTDWEEMTTAMGSINYLNKVHGDAKLDMLYKASEERIEFGENTINLNNLVLGFAGQMAFIENGYDLDISYQSKESTFKNLMSLIPAVYKSEMAGVETKGDFSLGGFVKGQYLDTSDDLPSFQLKLNVRDGSFAYPDLPSSLENVAVDLKIVHPGGDMNNLEIDLRNLYFEGAKDPFSAKLKLKNTMTDPFVDGMIKGELNLEKWNTIIPMDEPLAGKILANTVFTGKQSDFENSNLGNVKAEGDISLYNFYYHYADYNLPVTIDSVRVILDPNKFDLPFLQMKTGNSDYSARGKINNAFSWYLSDAPLSGSFTMNSKKIDLNEFMGDDVVSANEEDSTTINEEAYEVIRVPENIDFVIRMTVDEMLYENMILKNVSGKAIVDKGVVTLDPLNMDFMEGEFALKGDYDATEEIPKTSFVFQIKQLPMPSAMELSMVSAYLPIAKNIVGNLNTSLSITTSLDNAMMPILNSINGNGVLKTNGLSYSSDALRQIDKFFNTKNLTKISFDEPNLSFSIEDGKLIVKPVNLKLGSQKFRLSGSHSLEQELNYELQTKVKVSDMKLPAELSLLNLAGNASVDVKLHVTGTMDNPKITPKFGDIEIVDLGKELIEQAKDSVITIIKDMSREEADKLLAEAKKQADALVVEAKKQAAIVKAEAKKQADAAKKEAQKQADQLIAEAKDPLAKFAAKTAADQVIKQANKEIDKLKVEADKQADALVFEAQKQADAILKIANEQADALINGN
jgi:cell division septum initiation protein DivIVA